MDMTAAVCRYKLYAENQKVVFLKKTRTLLYLTFCIVKFQLYQYIYENHPAIVFFAANQTELRWGQTSVPEHYPRINMRDATLLSGPILMDNRKIIIVTFSWYDIPNANIAIVVRKRNKFGQTSEFK